MGAEKEEIADMGFLSGISSFVKEHSEVIHGVLDVAGFVPGLGAIPDLANAALYAAEGNVKEFVWSAASAVPLIGDTIGLAGKTGKVVKIAEKGADGIDAINSLEKAKNIETVLSKTGGKAVTGALSIKSGTKDVNTAFDIIKNETKEICTNGKCFTGDTLIYTSHGYKAIKEIKKGDEVYSRNIETGETGVKEVEEVFCTTAHTIYHICVDSKEEIKTTAYHRFYIQEQGWISAINLREGDILETMDGTLNITGIVRKRHEKPIIVYNFHVKDWKAYFVSKIKIYVHNGLLYKDKFVPPVIYKDKDGILTNGKYKIDITGMNRHRLNPSNGKKSQFLYDVDSDKAVLDASAYADKYNLWKGSDHKNKAKVYTINGPVGVIADTGELTDYINVYRDAKGKVHGCPATPPK